jgi:hypothetical protein
MQRVSARRGRLAAIVVALLVAGCGGELSPSPSARVTASSATESPAPSTVSPAPSPAASLDLRDLVAENVSCGDNIVFPGRGLQNPPGAEAAPDALGEALRSVLADSGDPQMQATGWRVVKATGGQAVFVARAPDGASWSVVALAASGSGWTADMFGTCHLTVVLGAGVGTAEWWLDPAAPPPPADAREIPVLVLEQACANGKPAVGRIAPPVIVYRPDAVVVAIGVFPVPGDADCPGNPPTKYRLKLAEPLRDRVLLDGGVVPPRDARVVPEF